MLSVNNLTRKKVPAVPFSDFAQKILPTGYDLSLVLCGDTRTRALNQRYRNKDKAANVLSFPLTKNTGEIFLNPRRATREAKKFGRSASTHLACLFIHGCLHLKGMDHGDKMESEERKYAQLFRLTSLDVASHHHRS